MLSKLIKKHQTAYATIVIWLIWYLIHLTMQTKVVPNPFDAISTFVRLLSGELLFHLGASTLRILISIIFSLLIGGTFGLFLGLNDRFDRFFGPILYLLYPIPKIAFLPVFMILFGLGNTSKIILITVIIMFQVLVTIRDSVKGLSRTMFLSVRSTGASKLQIYQHLILPAILPKALTALRLSVGTSISVLFFAENFATRYGIGYFIMDAWTRINYLEMYAGIIAISLLGLFIFKSIDLLEQWACNWASLEKGEQSSYFK
ncbi:NitT/TauT family transport system permease protein [Amphibacillus marinus]|uniref:NitT/TauT family transport system permease protein n=1 Tax=Amphibacillus marinus TaxID=872970 RepID=A0A1H8IHF9_9BACI|nr:ABC transporter permease [Amphibacillus marinus]SEN67666.1 NitT/TauT family transport system permease protein [Amphibacillus marinus]